MIELLNAGAAISRRGSNRLSLRFALPAAAWAALFGYRANTFDIIVIAALSFMAYAAFATAATVRWVSLDDLYEAVRARAIAAVLSRFSAKTGLVLVVLHSAKRKQLWLCGLPPTEAAELGRLVRELDPRVYLGLPFDKGRLKEWRNNPSAPWTWQEPARDPERVSP